MQQAIIKKQEEFRKLVEKLSHDVISLLQSLERFKDTCKHLNAAEVTVLRDINDKIQNLAGIILNLREKSSKFELESKERSLLVPLLLENIIAQKRHEYQGQNTEFKYSQDLKDKSVFMMERPPKRLQPAVEIFHKRFRRSRFYKFFL